MLNRCPRYLPPLHMMLDDIGAPSSHQVAKCLQVPLDVVDGWRAADHLPHVAGLALFWVTQWGQSLVDSQAVNDARLQAQLAGAARREADALRVELSRLLVLGDFGCANAPTLAARPRVEVVAARRMAG